MVRDHCCNVCYKEEGSQILRFPQNQARGHANLNRHVCSLRLLSPIGKLRSSSLGILDCLFFFFFLSIYYFLIRMLHCAGNGC